MMTRFIGYLFSIMAMLFLAGALGLAGMMWWYGRDLPEYEQLADYKPPELSRVLDDDGAIIARFAREQRVFTSIDEVPPLVKNAFISAEDKNFYHHKGVDLFGLAKAMARNVRKLAEGGRLGGASTITQQVVKNMLLTNERSIGRKAREAVLAVKIEQELSKDRILEIYLNQIYLGARSYGVGAAAQNYFGKKLNQLTPEEAAYLAALPKAPSTLHPVRNYDTALARRNYVLTEMAENDHLPEDIAALAKLKPLETRLNTEAEQEEVGYDWNSAYMIEEVRGRLLEAFEERAAEAGVEQPEAEAESALYGGGLTIRTTIDRELQAYASAALRDGLSLYEKRRGYRGPVDALDPDGDWRDALEDIKAPRDMGDWRLGMVLTLREDRALVGLEGEDKAIEIPLDQVKWARRRGEDDELSPKVESIGDVFARGDVIYAAVDEENDDGTLTWGLRQLPEANGAVIAIEPSSGRIVAMQGGFSAQQSVFNRATQAARQPGSSFKPFVYAAALDHGYTPASIVLDAPVTVPQGDGEGLWKPTNYASGKFYGPIPLRVGLEKSRNLITVRLAQDVGMDVIADYAKRFNVYDSMPSLLSYSLGAGETTLLRMATAYAMFVNGGKYVTPKFVEGVLDAQGQPVTVGADWVVPEATEGEQIIDPVTAFQTVSLMEGVVLRGTATKLTRLGFPVGGKTGTTNSARDAWFVGFTPDLVFGCYIGFDTPRSLGRKASGGALCGPVFEQFMRDAMRDRTPRKFTPPEGVQMIKINRTTGRRVSGDVFGKDVIYEAFRTGTAPTAAPAADTAPTGSFIPSPDEQQPYTGASLQPAQRQLQPQFQPQPQPQYAAPAAGTMQPVYDGVQSAPQPAPRIYAAPTPAPDPNEPLIRIDPLTGQIIVAQDPAIRVEAPEGDVVYRASSGVRAQPTQPQYAPQPVYAPTPTPTTQIGNSSDDLQEGRGLY